MSRVRCIGLLLLCAVVAASQAWIHIPAEAGIIQGPEVSRPAERGRLVVQLRTRTGAPVPPRAVVRVNSPALKVARTAEAQENGRAVLADLPLGEYQLEVQADGFKAFRDLVRVFASSTDNPAVAELEPPGDAKPATPWKPPDGALETLGQAMHALSQDDLDVAAKHLQRAQKLAPDDANVTGLLGVLHLKLGQRRKAEEFLTKSLAANPYHVGSLSVLGRLLHDRRAFAQAIPLLERTVLLTPSIWDSQWTLASAYYRQGALDKAFGHAQRAIELVGPKAAEVRLLTARILAARGNVQDAVAEVKTFLQQNPDFARVAEAEQLLATLEQPDGNPVARLAAFDASITDRVAGGPTTRFDIVRPYTPPPFTPGVDERVLPTYEGVPCPLAQVLAGARRQMQDLVGDMQRFSAKERIEYAQVDEKGDSSFTVHKQFEYVVSVGEPRPGILDVMEMRQGPEPQVTPQFPLVTNGMVAIVFLFHPFYAGDFEFRCEGLTHWAGRLAWQVYFEQREDRPGRIHVFRVRTERYPLAMRGRAWVGVNQYSVARLHLELAKPLPQVGFLQQRIVINYGPVSVPKRQETLWLPSSAEMYAVFRGKRYRLRHNLRDYTLFSVDTSERVSTPPGQ